MGAEGTGFWKQPASADNPQGETRLEAAKRMMANGQGVAAVERFFNAKPNSLYAYLPKKGKSEPRQEDPADGVRAKMEARITELKQRISDLEVDNATLLQQRDGAQAEVAILKARSVQDDPLKRDERAEYETLLEFIDYQNLRGDFDLFEAGVNFGKRQAERAA